MVFHCASTMVALQLMKVTLVPIPVPVVDDFPAKFLVKLV